eukprot:GEZU01007671.1.p1 GENE.GEZU01007671.1~~GEZU01007671.1.p1  ORF type:complete len:110 (+),score=16.04 GEZU01007671.1:187-516(+)
MMKQANECCVDSNTVFFMLKKQLTDMLEETRCCSISPLIVLENHFTNTKTEVASVPNLTTAGITENKDNNCSATTTTATFHNTRIPEHLNGVHHSVSPIAINPPLLEPL